MDTKITTVTLKLHGHYSGKTITLNGVKFIDGKVKLHGPTNEVESLMGYLGKSYQALPEVEVKKYGTDQVEEIIQSRGSEEVSSDVLPVGEGSAEDSTHDLGGADDFNEDGSGRIPGGGGSGESEGDRFEGTAQGKIDPVKLKNVLESLSPTDDSCWTTLGLAKLDKVCTLYGNEGVTRRDVDAVWPGLTRKSVSE